MNSMIELKNYGITEYCILDKTTGKTSFSKISQVSGFTGLYFKDENTFFAIYPSKTGPTIFFKGKEYEINTNLTISLFKQGKNRKFKIVDYSIEIDYMESPYIGFDSWSDEIDVDLFFKISQSYKEEIFYERYTLKA